jgi:hypothetical protein
MNQLQHYRKIFGWYGILSLSLWNKRNKKMTTIYIDYPTQMVFRTKKTFENDRERTEYLHDVLKRKVKEWRIYSFHHWSDFVVELVEDRTTDTGHKFQYWVIGS